MFGIVTAVTACIGLREVKKLLKIRFKVGWPTRRICFVGGMDRNDLRGMATLSHERGEDSAGKVWASRNIPSVTLRYTPFW